MKIIFKIAQAELRTFFCSPIAWFVSIVFIIVAGLMFVMPLEGFAKYQELMLASSEGFTGFDATGGLTFHLFKFSYAKILEYFYLFLPLITMGVMSREVTSGSIKLLYSAPIRSSEIILGKYLGLVLFNSLLLILVAMLLIVGGFAIEQPDISWLLSALLGFFLLSNTYAAIGLFISCCTNYQIVAGILTYVLFFILNSVASLWQQYDFFRDITYFFSISGRVEYMLFGLISSRDILYFLLIIALFIGFAIIRIRGTRVAIPSGISLLHYSLIFLGVIILGYLSSRPGNILYVDVTHTKANTIHPATQAVFKELDGSPLTVTLHANLFHKNFEYGKPQNRNTYVWRYWEHFVRFYPNIKLQYEYYYDINPGDSTIYKMYPNKNIHQIAEVVADKMNIPIEIFKTPKQHKAQIDLSDEPNFMMIEMTYKGRKEILRTYDDPSVLPDENHISGTIRRLVRDSTPKILFTTGHYERSPYKTGKREYIGHTTSKVSREALINKGVDIDTCNLMNAGIPLGLSALVIADPKTAFKDAEKQTIEHYIHAGGNAIFYGEPGKQYIINELLQQIGVELEEGTIVMPNAHEVPHMLYSDLTHIGNYLGLENELYNYQIVGKKPARITTRGAAHIRYKEVDGFKVDPIVTFKKGGDSAWIEKGNLVIDSAAPKYSLEEGDLKLDSFVVGVQLIRHINNKEQRILVFGDADFMSSERGHGDNLYNAGYSWVLQNEYPVYHNKQRPKDVFIAISNSTAEYITILFLYIIPSTLLLAGALVLIRRKRK